MVPPANHAAPTDFRDHPNVAPGVRKAKKLTRPPLLTTRPTASDTVKAD